MSASRSAGSGALGPIREGVRTTSSQPRRVSLPAASSGRVAMSGTRHTGSSARAELAPPTMNASGKHARSVAAAQVANSLA